MNKKVLFSLLISISFVLLLTVSFSKEALARYSEKIGWYDLYDNDLQLSGDENDFSFPCEGSVEKIYGNPGECYNVKMGETKEIEIEPFTLVSFSSSCDVKNDAVCLGDGGRCSVTIPEPYQSLNIKDSDGYTYMYVGDSSATLEYGCNQCVYGTFYYFAAPTECKITISTQEFDSCGRYCGEIFGGTGKMEPYWGRDICNCYCPDKVVEIGEKHYKCKGKLEEEGLTPETFLEIINQTLDSDKKEALIGLEDIRDKEKKIAFVKKQLGIDLSDAKVNTEPGKKMYIIYSESIDEYRESWIAMNGKFLAALYMADVLNVQPQVVHAKDSNEAFEYMVLPDGRDIFYFSHQDKSSIEEIEPDDLQTQFRMAKMRNLTKIHGKEKANEMIKEMGWEPFESLGKEHFVSFTCNGANNEEMIKRTVKKGGKYYAHKGKLYSAPGTFFGTQTLEKYTRD